MCVSRDIWLNRVLYEVHKEAERISSMDFVMLLVATCSEQEINSSTIRSKVSLFSLGLQGFLEKDRLEFILAEVDDAISKLTEHEYIGYVESYSSFAITELGYWYVGDIVRKYPIIYGMLKMFDSTRKEG